MTHIAEVNVQSAPSELIDQDVAAVSIPKADDMPHEACRAG
jgi:hypothetical protein